MKFVRPTQLYWLLCLLLNCPPSWPETRLLVVDLPPYGYFEGGHPTGIAYELLQEAARRVRFPGKVELMPLARVLTVSQSEPNVLASLPRLPSIEQDYQWLVELVQVPIVLIAAKDSKVDISTIQGARNLRIGVSNASPVVQVARANGFTRIELASRSESNAIKLARGRIDAWLVSLPEGAIVQKLAGLPEDGLRVGAKLDNMHGYIAANLSFDKKEAAKWSAAFADMKKDGSYADIVRRYHFEPLP